MADIVVGDEVAGFGEMLVLGGDLDVLLKWLIALSRRKDFRGFRTNFDGVACTRPPPFARSVPL